jgi:hypothetical protein
MFKCATGSMVFTSGVIRPLEVDFLGGRLTSDGGLVWLAEADEAVGLTASSASAIPEWRTRRGQHELDQGSESGLFRRSPQLPPLLGQSVPTAVACRGLLVARHPAAVAHASGRRPDDPGNAPTTPHLDRRLGPRTPRPRSLAARDQSPQRKLAAAPRIQRNNFVNNSG